MLYCLLGSEKVINQFIHLCDENDFIKLRFISPKDSILIIQTLNFDKFLGNVNEFVQVLGIVARERLIHNLLSLYPELSLELIDCEIILLKVKNDK